jgi:alkylhydroperoxidase family enzyme
MGGREPLKLFRTVARNPRVLSRMIAGGLLDKGSISLRLRELMILRTTALCGAEYEWGVHVAGFGHKAGWTAEEVERTVAGDASAWPAEAEQLAVKLADALHAHQEVDDALWQQLRSCYAEDQLIELVMLAGFYHAVSYLVNTFRIEHETGAPRFPTNKR